MNIDRYRAIEGLDWESATAERYVRRDAELMRRKATWLLWWIVPAFVGVVVWAMLSA
jgi:hypothetical protein